MLFFMDVLVVGVFNAICRYILHFFLLKKCYFMNETDHRLDLAWFRVCLGKDKCILSQGSGVIYCCCSAVSLGFYGVDIMFCLLAS